MLSAALIIQHHSLYMYFQGPGCISFSAVSCQGKSVETLITITVKTHFLGLSFVSFQDKGWPRPVLDGSSGPVITEALMPESPSKFPHDIPSASTANPQEDERVPHVQDFLSQSP